MTREEAIRHFEYGISHDIFSEPVTSYARLAVAALREQEEREINRPLTNADRIRAMSNKGIAKLFVDAAADGCPPEMYWDCCKDEYGMDGCEGCWEKWLQQPAEGGGRNGAD